MCVVGGGEGSLSCYIDLHKVSLHEQRKVFATLQELFLTCQTCYIHNLDAIYANLGQLLFD